MAKNITGFGGRLAEHHAKKLLKERANDLRLQQHQQWQSKPSSNIPKKPPPPHVLDQKKPPSVESKPRVLKRELLDTLSYKEMKNWAKHLLVLQLRAPKQNKRQH